MRHDLCHITPIHRVHCASETGCVGFAYKLVSRYTILGVENSSEKAPEAGSFSFEGVVRGQYAKGLQVRDDRELIHIGYNFREER